MGSRLVMLLQRRFPQARIVVIDDMRKGTFKNLLGDCGPSDTSSVEQAAGESAGRWSFRGEVMAEPVDRVDLVGLAKDVQPDVIFHLAAITDTTVDDEAAMLRQHLNPFEQMLHLAEADHVKLVWCSSAATYGKDANGKAAARQPFAIEDAGEPANVYGFSKWMMECLAVQAQHRNPDAHIVGLRYFNVFGPGEQNKGKMASMVYQLAQQMLKGQAPRIFHDGEQARDQVYVKDVAEGTLAAAMPGVTAGVYNIASGVATSFNQVVKSLNHAMGTEFDPDYIDNPYDHYQDFTLADLSANQTGMNWMPRYEPHHAIVEYARWLRGQGS